MVYGDFIYIDNNTMIDGKNTYLLIEDINFIFSLFIIRVLFQLFNSLQPFCYEYRYIL